mgnify:CR=1 FL=1
MPLVMELVQNTIAANRTSQKFILLEGLCNSNKLESGEQRLELRFMDEFFAIEKGIGEVFAVISLQFKFVFILILDYVTIVIVVAIVIAAFH